MPREEAVEEERALEEDVDQCIEKVPYEQHAGFQCRFRVKEVCGDAVRGTEDDENAEEREDGCEVDGGTGGGEGRSVAGGGIC